MSDSNLTIEELGDELGRALERATELARMLNNKLKKVREAEVGKEEAGGKTDSADEEVFWTALDIVATRWPRTCRGQTSSLPILSRNALLRSGVTLLSEFREVVATGKCRGRRVRFIGPKGREFLRQVLQEAERISPA